ncbi:hypothetical protein HWV62_41930 [Athelia sp. TMB]|nr:hypothetical protein HWV62_41930 [Athelia sp. TMB]
MAVEILEATIIQSPIKHKIHHDLESSVWTLGYAVWRRCALALCGTQLENHLKLFRSVYGHHDAQEIINVRTGGDPIRLPRNFYGEISNELSLLFEDLCEAILAHGSGRRRAHTPLTYESLLTPLSATIASLQDVDVDMDTQ